MNIIPLVLYYQEGSTEWFHVPFILDWGSKSSEIWRPFGFFLSQCFRKLLFSFSRIFRRAICIHFFHFCTFCQNFKTHKLKTFIILYSIHFRKMVKIFDWVQSLQTRDNFHGKLVKFKNGFSQVFVFNVIPKTNTKVRYGCW